MGNKSFHWLVVCSTLSAFALSACSQNTGSYKFIGEPFSQNDSDSPKKTTHEQSAEIPVLEGTESQASSPRSPSSEVQFTIESGNGKISAEGMYRGDCGGSCPADTVVLATDSEGNTFESRFRVYGKLALPSLPAEIVSGDPLSAGPATGGYGEIKYSISPVCKISDSGAVSSCPSVNAPVSVVIEACDTLRNCEKKSFSLVPDLTVTPSSKVLYVGETFKPVFSGGVGSKTCAVSSNASGAVDPSACLFTASVPGVVNLTISDSGSPKHSKSVAITVVAKVALPDLNDIVAGDPLTAGPATGGSGPISYSISPICSINAQTGVISACPAVNATTVITVKACDSLQMCDSKTFKLEPLLSLSPEDQYIRLGEKFSPVIRGGVGTKVCSLASGVGSVNAASCEFTPSALGVSTVQVIDQGKPVAHKRIATITVVDQLSLSVSPLKITLNKTATAVASGGAKPYNYSVLTAGAGSINPTTGVFTPAVVGSPVIQVKDKEGKVATQTITVVAPYSISLSPAVVSPDNLSTILHAGGVGPYVCSVISGPASLMADVLRPTGEGSAKVECRDSLQNVASATLQVSAPFDVKATPSVILLGKTSTVKASGGVSPYRYSIVFTSGPVVGFNAKTGVLTGNEAGDFTVKGCDSLNNCKSVIVKVVPAYSISLSPARIAVGNSSAILHTGGLAPYKCSVVSGPATISDFSIQGTASGNVAVECKDSADHPASASLEVSPAFLVSADPLSIVVGKISILSAMGGIAPYVFSKVSGNGTFDSPTGKFTATSPGDVILQGCDSLSPSPNCQIVKLKAYDLVTVTANPTKVGVNSPSQLSVNGGMAPYDFVVSSGAGAVSLAKLQFTSPSIGLSKVKVTDSLGNVAEISIEVVQLFAVNPSTKTLSVGQSFTPQFTGVNGALNCGLKSGKGRVASMTGQFTASEVGTAVVECSDASLAKVSTAYTVVAGLALSPASVSLSANQTQVFTASGGVGPYQLSLESGLGGFVAATGTFSSLKLWSGSAGSSIVKAADSAGAVVRATVELMPSIVQYGVKNENIFGGASVVDAEENLYLVGVTSAVAFGEQLGVHGKLDCAIQKLSPTGKVIWSKQIGGGVGSTVNCVAHSVVLDSSENLYFVGSSDSASIGPFVFGSYRNRNGFIGKMDKNGKLAFIHQVGSAVTPDNVGLELDLREIAISKNDEIYVSGITANGLNFPEVSGSNHKGASITPIVLKIDTSGKLLRGVSATFIGSSTSEVTSHIGVDSKGDVVLVGYSTGCGKVSITGINCANEWESRIQKMDGALSKLYWNYDLGGVEGAASGFAFDADQNIILAGTTRAAFSQVSGERGVQDLILLKISPDGKLLDHSVMGAGKESNDAEVQWSYRVKVTNSSEVLVAGSVTKGSVGAIYGVSGKKDLFLFRLNGTLDLISQSKVGFPNAELSVSGMVVDSKGDVYITGDSDLAIPTLQIGSHGAKDFFSVKFNAKGVAQQ
jgi:hypothetical protein